MEVQIHTCTVEGAAQIEVSFLDQTVRRTTWVTIHVIFYTAIDSINGFAAKIVKNIQHLYRRMIVWLLMFICSFNLVNIWLTAFDFC